MRNVKRALALLLALLLLLTGASAEVVGMDGEPAAPGDALTAHWTADSAAAAQLRRYVERVTDAEDPESFIPVQDRIAVFDMDGTLTCETFFTCFETMLFIDFCENHLDEAPWLSEHDRQALRQTAAQLVPGYKAGDGLTREFVRAYSGMTVRQLYDCAVAFSQKKTASFVNMRYCDGFFLPMAELVEYLYENGFSIYVVSGGERTITRAMVDQSPIGAYVPSDHVIGTDFEHKLAGNEKTPFNRDYDYGENGVDDPVVITDGAFQKNLNANKPLAIEREIGRRPVLAFGNSSSDYSMLNYALIDNPYPAQAYMVVADDAVREWGAQDWAEKSAECAAMGYIPISMKDDFADIYPASVKKASRQYQSVPEAVDLARTFPSWNADSETLKALVDFVADCANPFSDGYLDPADRIATFDMDGTILCEKAPIYVDYCLTLHRVLDDPDYEATEEEREALRQTRDRAWATGEKYDPQPIDKSVMVAKAFAGMKIEDFRQYVIDFVDNTPAVGFEGMTYGESFYKPMIEVIDFLRANDFEVWMVSACEREVVRALMQRYDFPLDHIVATDVPYVATGKGDEPADEYNMSSDEDIVLGMPLDPVEVGMSGKPAAIAREIGRRPVLAFGNSSGDFSMLNYAEGNPDHEGMGFFVVCDDTVREYGSDEKAADFYDIVAKEGWTAISMANDWATIYGENVVKTALPGAPEALPDAA